MLLYRKGAESHLKAVEKGSHGGGTGHVHLVVPLKHLHHAAVHHLGIKSFKRQEHYGEVRRIRRSYVFISYIPGFLLDGCFKKLPCLLSQLSAAAVVSVS